MKETPGQLLVRLLDEVMSGGDPAKLNKELQKAEAMITKQCGPLTEKEREL